MGETLQMVGPAERGGAPVKMQWYRVPKQGRWQIIPGATRAQVHIWVFDCIYENGLLAPNPFNSRKTG